MRNSTSVISSQISLTAFETGMKYKARQIRILILSKHAMFRDGLKRLLDAEPGFSEQAVKYHLTNIYNKTGMSSRLELARFAIRHHRVREV